MSAEAVFAAVPLLTNAKISYHSNMLRPSSPKSPTYLWTDKSTLRHGHITLCTVCMCFACYWSEALSGRGGDSVLEIMIFSRPSVPQCVIQPSCDSDQRCSWQPHGRLLRSHPGMTICSQWNVTLLTLIMWTQREMHHDLSDGISHETSSAKLANWFQSFIHLDYIYQWC